MGKKGKHSRGGRARAKGTRPRSSPSAGHRRQGSGTPDRGLLDTAADALASGNPVDLLVLTSALLALTDPRTDPPVGPGDEAPGSGREELLQTLIVVDRPETTGVLAAMRAMVPDDAERQRIGRELAQRSDPLPIWLSLIDGATATRSVEMTHVLGDGDNVIVGVRLPSGHELSAMIYIDHNVGTLVKDASVFPMGIDTFVRYMRTQTDDPDMAWTDMSLADVRAQVTAAIQTAAVAAPPFETETWPAARPLVEWIMRLLPEGGRGYVFPEWPEDARAEVASRFLASSHAASLDEPDHQDLVDTLVWFGCDEGPRDPLRWSPVSVEVFLADWLPRTIVGDPDYVAKAPDVLRAFIRFAHELRGVRPELTAETLAAVDVWEPHYLDAIRSPSDS